MDRIVKVTDKETDKEVAINSKFVSSVCTSIRGSIIISMSNGNQWYTDSESYDDIMQMLGWNYEITYHF